MINVVKHIRQAYFEALSGQLGGVPVYKEEVLPAEDGSAYVLIRVEGETMPFNNARHVYRVVMITEVVAVSFNTIYPENVDDVDDRVVRTLKPLISSTFPVLPAGSYDAYDGTVIYPSLQFVSITPESSTYLVEDDGDKKYYRKITRWTNRIVQLTT